MGQSGWVLLLYDDEKPTCHPCATSAELFIALFYPSATKIFQLHPEFFFFKCTSCDFSLQFAVPRLSVVGRSKIVPVV